MQLTGQQLKQFRDALLSAFPTSGDLAQMVSFELNENLNAIAGGQNHSEVVFNLIQWAQARGQSEQLMSAATNMNPDNPQLRSFVAQCQNSQSPAQQISTQSSTTAESTSTVKASNSKITVFFSYSHKDEDLRDELATHLSMLKRKNIIEDWHDRQITAGSDWANAISANLDTADIVLLLVSANFLASDYCYDKEMTRAMERNASGVAIVIPIILKPCDWHDAPFGKLQALPKNTKPVTTWDNRDEAFLDIAQGIRVAVERLKQV